MKKTILSDKHEKFCQEYMVNGFNASKAYQSVYEVSDKVSDAAASRLLKNVRIKERLDELKKENQQYYQITKEELLNDLKDIKNTNKGVRDSIAMKAIEVINKMLGFNEPERQDITITEQPLFLDDEGEN